MCCETCAVRHVLWDMWCETCAVKHALWNVCCDKSAVKWNICGETSAVKHLRWNICAETSAANKSAVKKSAVKNISGETSAVKSLLWSAWTCFVLRSQPLWTLTNYRSGDQQSISPSIKSDSKIKSGAAYIARLIGFCQTVFEKILFHCLWSFGLFGLLQFWWWQVSTTFVVNLRLWSRCCQSDRANGISVCLFMVWTSISMELEIGLHDVLLCLTLISLITVGIFKALVCFFDVDTMKMQTQVGSWASGFGPKPS